MSELEKFDDLLRSKLSERDFPFDEHNWDKLDSKIELAEKRKRSKRFAIIFASGVALGVLIMLPFIMNKNGLTPQTTQPIASSTNSIVNQVAPSQPLNNTNSPSTPTTASSHPISSGSNNSVSQPIASVDNNKTNGNKVSGNNNTAPVSPVVASNTKKQKPLASSADKTNNADQYTYVRPTKEKHSYKSANNNSLAVSQNTNPSTISPTATSNNDILKNTQVQNTNTEAVNNNTSITAVSNPNTSQTTATNPANTAEALNTSTTQVNNTVQNSNNVKTTEPTATSTGVNENTASTKTSITDSAATKDNSALANKDKASSPDSAADNFSNIVPPKKLSSSLTTISIDGGVGYSLGWMNDGATQGNGLSPVFGISTTHYFNAKWSAYLGVQFNELTNINTLYSSSTGQYGFGLNSNVNSVTLKTFYYAALPIRLQYCFGFNNMIGIGANVLYLVNTSSSVVTYNQDYFGTSGYTSANKSGYMDGISTIDLQAVIAYKRKIYNRFSAGVEFYYGMVDIEDNSFFGNNVFERNSGLKLILSYEIIK